MIIGKYLPYRFWVDISVTITGIDLSSSPYKFMSHEVEETTRRVLWRSVGNQVSILPEVIGDSEILDRCQ